MGKMKLRVFTFRADWGLPTTGPFALKLLSWLSLAGLPYEQVFQDNPAKGPAGKNPWMELDGEPIADSQRIIDRLTRITGFDIEEGLDVDQRAEARQWMRAFEEGFHQVLEWELFVHPQGAAYIDEAIRSATPPLVGRLIAWKMKDHFARQLHARGIGRFSAEEIEAIGRKDIDALAARLSQRPFLITDRPTLADIAVFGQVAPMVCWPMKTPVAEHAKSLQPVVDFVEHLRERCFGQAKPSAEPAARQMPECCVS
jgi:glutathione S-transferase